MPRTVGVPFQRPGLPLIFRDQGENRFFPPGFVNKAAARVGGSLIGMVSGIEHGAQHAVYRFKSKKAASNFRVNNAIRSKVKEGNGPAKGVFFVKVFDREFVKFSGLKPRQGESDRAFSKREALVRRRGL